MTRQEIVARLRNSIKEVNADTEYTNRYLWNVFWTNARTLLKQESDRGRLYNQSDIWQTVCVLMDPVSPLLCDCIKVPMDCVVYRSRFKLPPAVEGNFGRLYQFLSSPDLSQKIIIVNPFQFSFKNTKYNKEKYAFIHDDYLWTKVSWPYLIFKFLPDGDIPKEFECDCEDTSNVECGSLLYKDVNLSNWLIQPAISMALTELGYSKQMVADELSNTNSNDKGLNDR